MTLWLRVLALTARRSTVARVAWLLLVVGCWVVLYASRPAWLGRPLDTALYLHSFLVIVAGPALGAAGAWDVVSRRRDAAAAASARSGPAVLALPWAVGTLLALVLAVVLAGAASIRAAVAGPAFAAPAAAPLVLGVAVVSLEVAVAAGLALAAPSRATVVGVVAAAYAFIFWHTRLPMSVGLRPYFPLVSEHWDPWARPDDLRVAVCVAWCLVLAAVLILLAGAAARRPATHGLSLALVALAVALGAVIGQWTPHPEQSMLGLPRDPTVKTCMPLKSRGRVCTWPPDHSHLQVVAAGVDRLRRGLDNVLRTPDSYLEQGLTAEPRDTPMAEFFFPTPPVIVRGGRRNVSRSAGSRAARVLSDRPCGLVARRIPLDLPRPRRSSGPCRPPRRRRPTRGGGGPTSGRAARCRPADLDQLGAREPPLVRPRPADPGLMTGVVGFLRAHGAPVVGAGAILHAGGLALASAVSMRAGLAVTGSTLLVPLATMLPAIGALMFLPVVRPMHDAELHSPRPLRRYRLALLVGAVLVASGAAATGLSLAGAPSAGLTAARNLPGLLGIALLLRPWLGSAAWIAPTIFCATELLVGATNRVAPEPWAWTLHQPGSVSSWVTSLVLLLAGILTQWTRGEDVTPV